MTPVSRPSEDRCLKDVDITKDVYYFILLNLQTVMLMLVAKRNTFF